MVKRLDLKIGFQCNNRCLFCVQGDKRETIPFRDKEILKNDLKNNRKEYNSVVFTGGEPTLHPNFLELVEYSKKLNYKIIQIQTNGRSFSYKNFCRDTIKAGANQFSPSIHGPNSKIHDFLTNAPGSFKQTVQAIKNLKELKQEVVTNTVIVKQNYKYLPEIASLLVSLGVDQFQFAFVHIVGRAWQNRKLIVPRISKVIPYVKKGLKIGIEAGKIVMTEAIPYCLMKGYEKYIAEEIMPETKVIEAKFKIEDYKKYRLNKGKQKSSKCQECKYYSICEGPWREYPEMFGWEEFKPVKK